MKITQDVRDYAAALGVQDEAALDAGMKEKAEEFKKSGGKIYQEVARLARARSPGSHAGHGERLIAGNY